MVDDYKLGRELGKGATAKVVVGTKSDGTQHALKIFNLNNSNAHTLLRNELEVAKKLNHENIVKFEGFSEDSKRGSKTVAYIAQELVKGGELFDFVKSKGQLSESECKPLFRQMLSGVKHMHQRGFAHRDLKFENILLDQNKNVKIVDFGFVVPLANEEGDILYSSPKGTRGYMSPQVIAQDHYLGAPVDIFSLGVILFMMRAGHIPFKLATKDDRWYQHIAKGGNRTEYFWKIHEANKPGFFSKEFKELV